MTTLVVTSKPLRSLAHGYDLRVWHLCRALALHGPMVLMSLPFHTSSAARTDIDLSSLFAEVLEPEGWGDEPQAFLRHFRWSEVQFHALAYPQFYSRVS